MDGFSSTPRVNGANLSEHLGKIVYVIVDTNATNMDGYGNPTVKTTDGVDLYIQLPPGERLEGAYMQIEGKVVRAAPAAIEALRIQPVTGNFDAANYTKAVALMNGQYRDLFTN